MSCGCKVAFTRVELCPWKLMCSHPSIPECGLIWRSSLYRDSQVKAESLIQHDCILVRGDKLDTDRDAEREEAPCEVKAETRLMRIEAKECRDYQKLWRSLEWALAHSLRGTSPADTCRRLDLSLLASQFHGRSLPVAGALLQATQQTDRAVEPRYILNT